MASPAASRWSPPPDPDLEALAREGWAAWERDQPTVIAFDTETTGLEYHDTAFCATVAWKSTAEDIYGAPIGVEGFYFELDRFDSAEALRRIFARATVIVGHNLKFDLHKVERAGIYNHTMDHPGVELHDTEAMAHLDDEHRAKGLKDLAVDLLGFDDTILVPGKKKNKDTGEMEDVERPIPRQKYEIQQAREWAKKHYGLASVKDVGYHLLPRGTVVPYAIKDAEWTYSLAQLLYPRILRYPDTLHELYVREMDLTRTAIYSLESAGMGTRQDYVAAQIKKYRKKVLAHESDIEGIVGRQVRSGKIPPKERAEFFNPSSSSPDAGAYFESIGEGRPNYDAEQLRSITHPLAAKLLDYRGDRKILDSYFIRLQKDTGADGVYHPALRQHSTVTGRTSAGAEKGDD